MSQTLTIEISARAIPASNKKGFNSKTGQFFDAHKGKAAQVAMIRLFAQKAAADQGWRSPTDRSGWPCISCSRGPLATSAPGETQGNSSLRPRDGRQAERSATVRTC